ncbi:MAG: hypothetical protein P1U62_12120 [Alteraurantiacibacter sp. bin_em_oilr2.035]|nr:hypothetical protein [Alteraurantiacibacter sp. bin_em_oilr2.035]
MMVAVIRWAGEIDEARRLNFGIGILLIAGTVCSDAIKRKLSLLYIDAAISIDVGALFGRLTRSCNLLSRPFAGLPLPGFGNGLRLFGHSPIMIKDLHVLPRVLHGMIEGLLCAKSGYSRCFAMRQWLSILLLAIVLVSHGGFSGAMPHMEQAHGQVEGSSHHPLPPMDQTSEVGTLAVEASTSGDITPHSSTHSHVAVGLLDSGSPLASYLSERSLQRPGDTAALIGSEPAPLTEPPLA